MRTTRLDIRGLRYHVSEWGAPDQPVLLLLHGWMDCSATFARVAQSLGDHYHVVAPDLRGFGNTEHAQGYWFPDYFADVEELLDYYSPDNAVRLVGHSMGGNIALMYAGLRPDRVAAVMSLEALGLPETTSQDAPEKIRRWMHEILRDEPTKVYPDKAALIQSISKVNPALNDDIVDELVDHWGVPHGSNGAYRLKHDHKHRYTNPVRYNFDDVVAIWREITAHVGLMMAADSRLYEHFSKSGRIDQARELLKVNDEDYFVVDNSAHMLHLEQPSETAAGIVKFFSRN